MPFEEVKGWDGRRGIRGTNGRTELLMLEYRPSPMRASKQAISSSLAELEADWAILPCRYVVSTPPSLASEFVSLFFLLFFLLLLPPLLSQATTTLTLPQVRRHLRRNRHSHRLPRQRILRPFHRGLALPLVPLSLPRRPNRLRAPAHQQSWRPRGHRYGGTSGCV